MGSTDGKLVAIHQPNFLPWLGFFDKIRRSDLFVAMDNVQFGKTGAGTWTNRVQVIVNGEPAWVTMPIVRAFHGVRAIKEMEVQAEPSWRVKLLRTIENSYRRAPYFGEVFGLVEPIIQNPTSNLAEYNMAGIRQLCGALRLTTPIVIGSTLGVDGRATELLIRMVKAAGGTAYLAGGGAAGYQEDEQFREAGITLIYQEFHHPAYPQFNTTAFKPGLSIVDALMNCGFRATADLLGKPA